MLTFHWTLGIDLMSSSKDYSQIIKAIASFISASRFYAPSHKFWVTLRKPLARCFICLKFGEIIWWLWRRCLGCTTKGSWRRNLPSSLTAGATQLHLHPREHCTELVRWSHGMSVQTNVKLGCRIIVLPFPCTSACYTLSVGWLGCIETHLGNTSSSQVNVPHVAHSTLAGQYRVQKTEPSTNKDNECKSQS